MVLGFRIEHRPHRGSVLPRIGVERSAEGVRVVAATVGWKDALQFWLLAVFLAGMAVLIAVFVTNVTLHLNRILPLAPAGGVIAEIGRRYFRQRKLRRATLLVRPWPLRLGETAKVVFEQRLQNNAAAEAIQARLHCFEEAVTSSGNAQTTRRETRCEIPLDTSHASVGNGSVRLEWNVEIPDSGLPSFSVKSNRISWQLETITESGGVPVSADFELLVIPEVSR